MGMKTNKDWMIYAAGLCMGIAIALLLAIYISNGFCFPPDYYEQRVAYCEKCDGWWNPFLFHPYMGQYCTNETDVWSPPISNIYLGNSCSKVPHGPEAFYGGGGFYGC